MKPINTVTYINAMNQAKSVGKHIITVVTNGDKSREQERNTILSLKQEGAFEIPASGVFTRADSAYRTIFDPALKIPMESATGDGSLPR